MADLDAFDMHEAFAAQTWRTYNRWAANDLPVRCLVVRRRQEVDDAKFNVLGGSIAYGILLPVTGASG